MSDISDVMPQWCWRCATNGYHKPENCPTPDRSDVRSETLFVRCPVCIHEADRNPGYVWDVGTWCAKCQQHEHPGWRPCTTCKTLGFVRAASVITAQKEDR